MFQSGLGGAVIVVSQAILQLGFLLLNTNENVIATVFIHAQFVVEVNGVEPPFPNGWQIVRAPFGEVQCGRLELKVGAQWIGGIRLNGSLDTQTSSVDKRNSVLQNRVV